MDPDNTQAITSFGDSIAYALGSGIGWALVIMVVIALVPALLFGMYNVGYQHFALAGLLQQATFWNKFWFGFLAVLPRLIVSYVVGLTIEFIVAQWRHSC